MKVNVPPIKCQGIKTRLVPWIIPNVIFDGKGTWIEPFMGSGVVGFNFMAETALFCDRNPHIINFYTAIKSARITSQIAREFLEFEGELLARHGQDHYNLIRERFNQDCSPLDFLFLSRACFNGVMRFNKKGHFNVPYNHKPNRFSKAYITKVVNQIECVSKAVRMHDWEFKCTDFRETLSAAGENDFIYCDPPYAGRHVDYFNSWSDQDELDLYNALNSSRARFILSTWHSNEHRNNLSLERCWADNVIIVREHFYHVGAKEKNRKPMTEALILNYAPSVIETQKLVNGEQANLFY